MNKEKEVLKKWIENAHQEGDTLPEQLPKGGIDAQDEDGRTALHWACSEGHLKKAQTLLSKGAKISIQDNSGWTCLMCASSSGHVLIVRLLLNSIPANSVKEIVSIVNERGCNALSYACSKARVEIVPLLISAGSDIRLKDKLGATPLHRVASIPPKSNTSPNTSNDEQIVIAKILLEHKVDIDAKDNEGSTALHIAVQMRNEKFAKFLIDSGANLYSEDKEHHTPLFYGSDAFRSALGFK